MTGKKFIREWVVPILVAFVIFLCISVFFRLGEIDGSSMEPTYSDGNKVLIAKHPLVLEKGDIIIFTYTKEMEAFYQDYLITNNLYVTGSPSTVGEMHVKRIVGVPGDEIVIKDNILTINGEVYETSMNEIVEDQSYTLESDEYFVVGDNTGNSFDSRLHGPVKVEDLYGKLITNK